MAFTYSPGATQKDDIRLLIGDRFSTAPANARLEDEEIERLLALYGSFDYAAAAAAETLAGVFARLPEGGSGGLVPSRTRAQELMALARTLKARAATKAAPTAGGLRHSQKETTDSDLIGPSFRRGMLDHPESG